MRNTTEHRVVAINSEIINVSVECIAAGLRHSAFQQSDYCGMGD